MKIHVSTAALEEAAAQALVVLHEKGGLLGESSNTHIQRHLATFARDVEAKTCRREWFCTIEKEAASRTHHLLLDSVTFGPNAPHDEPLKIAAFRCVNLCREYSINKIAFAVHHKLAPLKAAAMLEGIMLGDFQDLRYKGDKEREKKRPPLEITFLVTKDQERAVRDAVQRTEVIAAAVNRARELVNAPHHDITPDALAKYAQTSAKRHGLRCVVLNEKQLQAKGHLPTWHVGRGSEYPPRMIVLSYQPAKPRLREHFGLIGKGMTFDSGGLCIKGRDSMHKMNGDMAGAAAVISAMEVLAELKFPARVTAVIASAHNAIDGAAFYPGCVLQAKNGKTIYVENTDAEGRLILTDCFHRAGEEGVEVMIDVATLTGACSAALGGSIGGLFTDDGDLRRVLLEAGANTGDDVWPLPLVKEYEGSLKHHLADLNNMSSDSRGGGAIHAANFLKNFVPEGVRWAHLDIAGVAQADKARRYYRTGGTGFGVRLLIEALRLWEARNE